jgi:hypothetical protein
MLSSHTRGASAGRKEICQKDLLGYAAKNIQTVLVPTDGTIQRYSKRACLDYLLCVRVSWQRFVVVMILVLLSHSLSTHPLVTVTGDRCQEIQLLHLSHLRCLQTQQ